MVKNILRIFFFIIILSVLIISYLSIFGVKTDKFNDLIKSQVAKQDKRFNVEFENVYIKLNIKEKSFMLNSKDINISILNEFQKISNIDLLIDLRSIFRKENKIKKIIINSKENNIQDLLKFVRKYKLNIPVLYLENSISKGRIIYNSTINIDNSGQYSIDFSGKIIDAKLNILGKERINFVNFDFNYKNKNLEVNNLKFKYKNINFDSARISINIINSLIKIKGDLKNNINSNLVKYLLNYDFKEFLDKNIFLKSLSDFEITFNKKFKLINYSLKTEIIFDKLDISLKKINLKNYLREFKQKIILNEGKINFQTNKKNISINVNSKYKLNENANPKNFLLNYTKEKSTEKYDFNIDLTEYDINLNDLNFLKKKNDQLLFNLIVKKNKKNISVNELKLFNNKNRFIIKNMKLENNFKIKDFSSVEAKYYNKENFLNHISITKKKNLIKLYSNQFDLSSDIEKALKSKNNNNFFEIFKNLTSIIDIEVKLARIDNEHSLKNVKGKVLVKNNKINKSDISAKFDEKNNFLYNIDKNNGKRVSIIYSDVAKPFVKKFSFIKGFEDGKLDYTSTEINKDLTKSELRLYDFKLKNMPTLTKLLSLASLQGIADLATGEGIRFNEFEMFFENSKNLLTINEIYALGPAISVLMEGYIEKNKLVSLRGTLVPATTINKTIAKIPLLGSILVGEKSGEGVFGVSFKIKGPPNNLDTRVNPIKTLAPRFISRTLDKLKKTN
tara:strand:- start:4039 stop:6234 length:2196 start_codon:yes stop_codon:yes gene_type:complete